MLNEQDKFDQRKITDFFTKKVPEKRKLQEVNMSEPKISSQEFVLNKEGNEEINLDLERIERTIADYKKAHQSQKLPTSIENIEKAINYQ